jgi:hypothetical protein
MTTEKKQGGRKRGRIFEIRRPFLMENGDNHRV